MFQSLSQKRHNRFVIINMHGRAPGLNSIALHISLVNFNSLPPAAAGEVAFTTFFRIVLKTGVIKTNA